MALKVKDYAKFIESKAPIIYKEKYDNVGLMIGNEKDKIKGILYSMDTTLEVIKEAKEKGANLIVSHHPLLFKKPSSITNESIQGQKIINLIKSGISVYAAHTNLDSVKDGMNDTIVEMFGFKDFDILDQCEFDYDSGIGRIVSLGRGMTLKDFIEKTSNVLETKNIRYTGNLDKKIRRIAIINGSGESYFDLAIKEGADCILTGDTTYHGVQELEEMGIAVVDPGHFNSEKLVYYKIMKEYSKEFLENRDIPVYFSEKEKDPFKFFYESF